MLALLVDNLAAPCLDASDIDEPCGALVASCEVALHAGAADEVDNVACLVESEVASVDVLVAPCVDWVEIQVAA
jgi:hypothetical protein